MFESFDSFKGALKSADKLKDEIHRHPDVKKAHDHLLRSYVSNEEAPRVEARAAYKKAFEAHPKHPEYKAAIRKSLEKSK